MSYVDPGRYLDRIRSSITAQLRRLAGERLAQLPLVKALQDPGDLASRSRPPGPSSRSRGRAACWARKTSATSRDAVPPP